MEELDDKRNYIVKAADELSLKDYMPAQTLAGTKASRMAMDACIKKTIEPIISSNMQSIGTRFVGYSVLSNISQEALIRAGVETTADEMTRKFINFRYDSEDGNSGKEKLINKMQDLYEKYHVKETFNEAMKKTGYFGGCLVYIDTGAEDEDLETPLVLDRKTFKKGSFKGFKIIEPINVCPAQYNSTDPLDKHYYNPEFWWVIQKRVHASRFLYFSQNDTPMLLKAAYNFFGIPSAQLALDYVAHFTANRESAQRLLNKFSLTCWKTPLGNGTAKGWLQKLKDRVLLFNRMRDNQGTLVLDKETEDLMQVNTPLGGVRDIVEMSLNLLCAIWHMPKILYLGEGEGGLNVSSAKQLQVWYDWILSQKEKIFDHPLDIVNKVLQLNEGLEPDENLSWEYPSMVEMDETERANLNKSLSDRDNAYINAGVISREEVRERLSLDKNSGYADIDVDDLPDMSEMNPLDGNDTPDDDDDNDPNGGGQPKPGEKANDEDLAFDMVDGNGRNHDELGRFCEKPSFSSFEDLEKYAEENELIVPFPEKYKGKTEEDIYKDIGFLDGDTTTIKSPIEDVTITKGDVRHLVNENNPERKTFLFSGIETIKNPNIIVQEEKGGKFFNKYFKVFSSGDKNKPFVQIVRKAPDGNFYTTMMRVRLKQVAKKIKGQVIYYSPSHHAEEGRSSSRANNILAQDSEFVKDFFDEFIIFNKNGEMAMDERWITVKKNHGNEEEKGRHLLLEGEGENQETPAEAMKRQWGVTVGKKGEKAEGKEEKKPEPKPEPKPEEKKEEPKPEEKEQPKEETKEPERTKTTAQEWAELLDKEKKGELTESEKARKKELEESEGFGESEDPKEKALNEMTDEEFENYGKGLQDKIADLEKGAWEKSKELWDSDKETTELRQKLEKVQEKFSSMSGSENDFWATNTERRMIETRIMDRREEIRDEILNTEEYKSLAEKKDEYLTERAIRIDKRRKLDAEFAAKMGEKVKGIDLGSMTEDEIGKTIEDLKKEIDSSDITWGAKESLKSGLDNLKYQAAHVKRTAAMPNKVKEYSKKTESLVKDFDEFENATDPEEEQIRAQIKEKSKQINDLGLKRDAETVQEKRWEINDQIRSVIDESYELSKKLDAKKDKRFEKIAEILRKNGDTGTKVVAGKSTIKGLYERLNGCLGGVLGKSIATDGAPKVQRMRGRAYYSHSDNIFKVSGEDKFDVVLHEYTHFLENRNKDMLRNSLAFLEYRTKGEKAEKLSKLTGQRGYGAGEIAKKDRFFKEYCGKVYSASGEYRDASACELMSMGVQRLFTDPAKFAKEDREYFDFVVGNLRGEL